jgi:CubicO group peptidase (beta-lactamase class C family)
MKTNLFPRKSHVKYGAVAIVGLLIAVLLPVWARSATAQPSPDALLRVPEKTLAHTASTDHDPVDPKEIEAFLDPIFATGMSDWHVPGAAVAIVKDGQILFSKGYGQANLEKGVPVDPDTTVFHVYSISKLFTATAIMQLVEQFKVELDEDVNVYLRRFQVKNSYPRPVTIENLLTHTAGFDDDTAYIGTTHRTADDMVPLGDYLAADPPSTMWQPGERYLYSNLAYSVLGAVIEEVSGMPFAQYVEENILRPLDMKKSSFLQPSPWASDVAVSYQYIYDNYKPLPGRFFDNPPPKALTATATDMAHFMIAHLQAERYGGSPMLQSSIAQDMHSQHFTYMQGDPLMALMAYGFNEAGGPSGRWLWKDGGGTRSSSSSLWLSPEKRTGIFLTYNTGDDSFGFMGHVVSQVFQHYWPAGQPSPATPLVDAVDTDRFTGIYRNLQYPHRTISKLLLLRGDDYPQVAISGDNTLQLRVSADQTVEPPFVAIQPGLFSTPNNLFHILFLDNVDGSVGGMTFGGQVFEKVQWYDTSAVQKGIVAFFILGFLAAVIAWIAWPVVGIFRRRNEQVQAEQFQKSPQAAKVARLAIQITSFLNLVFLVGVLLLLSRSDELMLEYGLSGWMVPLFVIPLVTTLLTVGLLVLTMVVWKDRYWTVLARIGYSLATLVAAAFVPFLLYWNLLGFQW